MRLPLIRNLSPLAPAARQMSCKQSAACFIHASDVSVEQKILPLPEECETLCHLCLFGNVDGSIYRGTATSKLGREDCLLHHGHRNRSQICHKSAVSKLWSRHWLSLQTRLRVVATHTRSVTQRYESEGRHEADDVPADWTMWRGASKDRASVCRLLTGHRLSRNITAA